MLNNLTISGVHSQITEKERQYARKKIGALEKFIPLRARASASAEVKLKQKKSKDKNTKECEVIIKLPGSRTITAHRSSTSFLAAIDETEDNLKNQLRQYKNTHTPGRLARRITAKLRRTSQPETVAS